MFIGIMILFFVTGTFNIVHAGHVRLLEFASKYGEVTVGINADPYLQKKYGDNAVPLVDRAYVLRNNIFVKDVVVFIEDEPSKLIRTLKPKYYIKGPDYSEDTLYEASTVKAVGAKLIIHPADKEYNSTELVEVLPDSAFEKFNKFS